MSPPTALIDPLRSRLEMRSGRTAFDVIFEPKHQRAPCRVCGAEVAFDMGPAGLLEAEARCAALLGDIPRDVRLGPLVGTSDAFPDNMAGGD